jgi:hypothetical protein
MNHRDYEDTLTGSKAVPPSAAAVPATFAGPTDLLDHHD